MSRFPRASTSPTHQLLKGADLDLVVKQLVLERIQEHLQQGEREFGPEAPQILSHPLVHMHSRAQLRCSHS